MAHPGEPLKADPSKLRVTADDLDGHGSGFRAAHETTHARAGRVVLGSGLSGAALSGMLAAWESDATRFGQQFTKHAQAHREAADGYVRTDTHGAGTIDDAAPTS